MVKNPPASAGDMGLLPGPGRFHVPLNNQACEPQLLSLCSRAQEPQLLSPWAAINEAHTLEPMLRNKRSHLNEKPAPQLKSSPSQFSQRKALAATKTQQAKNK